MILVGPHVGWAALHVSGGLHVCGRPSILLTNPHLTQAMPLPSLFRPRGYRMKVCRCSPEARQVRTDVLVSAYCYCKERSLRLRIMRAIAQNKKVPTKIKRPCPRKIRSRRFRG